LIFEKTYQQSLSAFKKDRKKPIKRAKINALKPHQEMVLGCKILSKKVTKIVNARWCEFKKP
jgi:hypothetical protein